jgi:hypothetical protein
MHAILQKLQGGDRRSIGRVDEVVDSVLGSAFLFEELITGLFSDDPILRMRTADAVEKVTRVRPELLTPHKKALIRLAGDTDQQEVRWHMAQILPRLPLKPEDRKIVVDMMLAYLKDKSKIVVTFALQALADFAADDKKLRPRVIRVLEDLTESGSPAVKSRGRKLLQKLTNQ